MNNYKIIVNSDTNSVKLIKFIRGNISIIKQMGVFLDIKFLRKKDLTKKLVKSLEKENISRLPVMIDPEGNKILGYKEIRSIFERNINDFNASTTATPPQRRKELATNTRPSHDRNEESQLRRYMESIAKGDEDHDDESLGEGNEKKMEEAIKKRQSMLERSAPKNVQNRRHNPFGDEDTPAQNAPASLQNNIAPDAYKSVTNSLRDHPENEAASADDLMVSQLLNKLEF